MCLGQFVFGSNKHGCIRGPLPKNQAGEGMSLKGSGGMAGQERLLEGNLLKC